MINLLETAEIDNYHWENFDIIKIPWQINPKTGQPPYILPMNKLLQIQSQAKIALNNLTFSLFTGCLAKFEICYTFRIQTQATDGYTLYINPLFTWQLYESLGSDGLAGLAFIMAHECMHSILNHTERVVKGSNKYLENAAADFEVNTTLCRLFPKIFTPELVNKMDGFYNNKYNKWPFEAIYNDIIKNNPKISPNPLAQQSQTSQQQQSQTSQQQQSQTSQQQQSQASQQQQSQAYKNGWDAAMADFKAGKLKI